MAGRTLDLNGFKQLMQSDQVASLYYFYGDESYLVEESLKELIEKALGSGLRDFNLEIFYGADFQLSAFKDVVETLPMMAARRVVVVREAQDLKAKDLEGLSAFLENPLETTTLIFSASKLDMRSKFSKKIGQIGVLVKFDRPFENQIPSWINYIAKKNGKSISNDAQVLMQQMVGVSLLDIDNEMKKLCSFTGNRELIEAEDVQAVVSKIRIESIFALSHAIGAKDRVAALLCLANLLENGENPIGVLALVSRHVRILGQVRESLDEKLSPQQMSSRVGVAPYFLKEYISQAHQWPGLKIDQTIRALHLTDSALKSSPVSAHIWLENFIVKTCDL